MITENDTGRSMLEMLGVLAIIGVLSVGGIVGYSKAMMKYKVNKAIEQVGIIVANIQSLYMQQKTYSGLMSWLVRVAPSFPFLFRLISLQKPAVARKTAAKSSGDLIKLLKV